MASASFQFWAVIRPLIFRMPFLDRDFVQTPVCQNGILGFAQKSGYPLLLRRACPEFHPFARKDTLACIEVKKGNLRGFHSSTLLTSPLRELHC